MHILIRHVIGFAVATAVMWTMTEPELMAHPISNWIMFGMLGAALAGQYPVATS